MADEPARETNMTFKQRLLREGRWAEAELYRAGLVEAGIPKAEAFRRTVAEFQPLDGSRTVAYVIGDTKAPKPKKQTRADRRHRLEKDAWWAYRNCHLEKPPKPPTGGAKLFLALAQESPAQFAQMMLTRVLPAEKVVAEESDGQKEDVGTETSLGLVDSLLREIGNGEAAAPQATVPEVPPQAPLGPTGAT